jgi:hypothetical protein
MKPNARKGRTGHLKQCIARTFLAIALVASSVPVSPRPATAIDDAADARIASMLATGEFVEGEAVRSCGKAPWSRPQYKRRSLPK